MLKHDYLKSTELQFEYSLRRQVKKYRRENILLFTPAQSSENHTAQTFHRTFVFR